MYASQQYQEALLLFRRNAVVMMGGTSYLFLWPPLFYNLEDSLIGNHFIHETSSIPPELALLSFKSIPDGTQLLIISWQAWSTIFSHNHVVTRGFHPLRDPEYWHQHCNIANKHFKYLKLEHQSSDHKRKKKELGFLRSYTVASLVFLPVSPFERYFSP